MAPLILASQSPRRKLLLEWAEIPFQVIVQPTDETYPPHLPVEEIAIHIARKKAEAVFSQVPQNSLILAADTIVVLEDNIIGKPKDKKDALTILSRLGGQKHQVITGVYLTNRTKIIEFSDCTEVTFYPLTDEHIEFYVDKYRPYDKAGAYAIQEWIGVVGIKNINGDFYNVMGLPISRVVKALDQFS